jgi:hypothetical protein
MLIKKTLFLIVLIAIFVTGLFAGKILNTMGSIDSPSTPGSTNSYTLEDIYQRLNDGTAGSKSTFTEPGSGPGSTMHTLNDIIGQAPAADDANGAIITEVLDTKTFWGLNKNKGEWGLQTGTAALGNNVSGAEGDKTFSIPNGFYSGKTATANDADLSADNIKDGVEIFGVTGSYTGAACITCSGTMNGTRWCDNGDGTVTDMLGYNGVGKGLVWAQNSNWGGLKPWRSERNDDDAHTRASAYGGETENWRLPTRAELEALTNGTEPVRTDSMRAFSGVLMGAYWSSTSVAISPGNAWIGGGVVFRAPGTRKIYSTYGLFEEDNRFFEKRITNCRISRVEVKTRTSLFEIPCPTIFGRRACSILEIQILKRTAEPKNIECRISRE